MVEKHIVRKSLQFKYDISKVHGYVVDVRAEHDGHVSTRDGLVNDGLIAWTFPGDFKGDVHFTVKGAKGGQDEGTIKLG